MTLLQSASKFYGSSIGKKIIVALTGLALVLFLFGHLTGNLLVFRGPDAINAYAKWLHSMPGVVWGARIGLLVCVVAHIVLTIQLTRANRTARPQAYGYDATRKATRASRTMIVSGLTLLAFIVYHLMHYTVCLGNDYRNPANSRYFTNGMHNAYNMIIDGFSVWYVTVFYLISMALLCMHLSHGIASIFQTLGLSTPGTRPLIEKSGKAAAAILFAGFASIPLAVMFGILK